MNVIETEKELKLPLTSDIVQCLLEQGYIELEEVIKYTEDSDYIPKMKTLQIMSKFRLPRKKKKA